MAKFDFQGTELPMNTRCDWNGYGTEFGYRAGIHAAVTGQPDFILYLIEKLKSDGDTLMDFADGYHEAMSAPSSENLRAFLELPDGCEGCPHIAGCYEQIGKNYRFRT